MECAQKVVLKPQPLGGWSPVLTASLLSCHNVTTAIAKSLTGDLSLCELTAIIEPGCQAQPCSLNHPAGSEMTPFQEGRSQAGVFFFWGTVSKDRSMVYVPMALNHGAVRNTSWKLYLHCCNPDVHKDNLTLDGNIDFSWKSLCGFRYFQNLSCFLGDNLSLLP